jgi:hypothetical protein
LPPTLDPRPGAASARNCADPIHAYREGIDQVGALAVFGQNRREVSIEGHAPSVTHVLKGLGLGVLQTTHKDLIA